MPYLEEKMNNLINRTILNLRDTIYTKISDLNVEIWKSKEPLKFDERFSGEHKVLNFGESWGDLFDCCGGNGCNGIFRGGIYSRSVFE